jgi:hypothetical protein
MMSDSRWTAPDGTAYDLASHEGRLGALRARRQRLSGEDFTRALGQARAADPYPVLNFTPGGVEFHSRATILSCIGTDANSPEFCRLLRRQDHPAGTVFCVLFWGNQHTYTSGILVSKGEPGCN